MENEKKVKALLVVEVLGRPKENVISALEDITKKIGEEKGVEVKEKTVHEPVELKDHKDLFTTYAEIEVEIEGIFQVVALMFKYMPSHIEILQPEKITLTNNDWGEVLNVLTRNLHKYDEVTRVLQNEKMILEKKLKELLGQKDEKKVEEKKD
jgi:hypothetical protein